MVERIFCAIPEKSFMALIHIFFFQQIEGGILKKICSQCFFALRVVNIHVNSVMLAL